MTDDGGILEFRAFSLEMQSGSSFLLAEFGRVPVFACRVIHAFDFNSRISRPGESCDALLMNS